MLRVLSIASWVALVVVCTSCGGGGGGGSGQAPTGPGPSSMGGNTNVQNAASMVLQNMGNPDPSLINLFEEMNTVYNAAAEPSDAYDSILISLLDSVQTQQDAIAVVENVRSGGDVFTTGLLQNGGSDEGRRAGLCPAATGASTNVYYVNGVLTRQESALASTLALRDYFKAQFPTEAQDMRFGWFYNRSGIDSGSFSTDVCNFVQSGIEWVVQAGCSSTTVSEVLCTIFSPEVRSAYESFTTRCVQIGGGGADFVQAFAQWTNTIAQNLVLSPLAVSQTMELANLIEQDVASGRKVILVPHSQGNFFVQSALALLPSSTLASVGVVSVASPTNYPSQGTYGDFAYHLLTNDAIRCVPGTTLAANLNNPASDSAGGSFGCSSGCCIAGVAAHEFVASYLKFEQSRTPILTSILNAYNTVPASGTAVGQGFFQATLTWNIPGDIDLYVDEPNGARVFYGNMLGMSGQLDRDDLTGTGPENYFICDQGSVETGTYRVFVNNFSGTTGTIATIALRAGTNFNTYTITLDGPNQGSNLIPVTEVTYNGAGFNFNP